MYYNTIIIGAGAAGIKAAQILTNADKKILLIEEEKVGGTCVNRGCIPTTSLINTCKVIDILKNTKRFGIDCSYTIDKEKIFKKALTDANNISNYLIKTLHNNPNITLISGKAIIIDKNIVKVNDLLFAGDNIIIATGAKPNIPEEFKNINYYTYKNIFENYNLDSIDIIGGGTIAVEFAYIFNTLGMSVTIYSRNKLLSYVPEELKTDLYKNFNKKNIKLKSINDYKYNNPPFICCGVVPNIPQHNISLDENNIYIIGDAANKLNFAHYAEYQAIISANKILGNKISEQVEFPYIIFGNPDIAYIGKITNNFIIKSFSALSVSTCTNNKNGYIVIYKDNDIICGIGIVHNDASKLIGEASKILNLNIREAHPTINEIFNDL